MDKPVVHAEKAVWVDDRVVSTVGLKLASLAVMDTVVCSTTCMEETSHTMCTDSLRLSRLKKYIGLQLHLTY